MSGQRPVTAAGQEQLDYWLDDRPEDARRALVSIVAIEREAEERGAARIRKAVLLFLDYGDHGQNGVPVEWFRSEIDELRKALDE